MAHRRTLSFRDRVHVAIARHVLARITRRIATTEGQVWFMQVRSTRPRRRMWLPGQPIGPGLPDGVAAGFIRIGVGGSEGEAMDPPMIEMAVDQNMFNVFVDGAVHVRNLQDVQLKALRDA